MCGWCELKTAETPSPQRGAWAPRRAFLKASAQAALVGVAASPLVAAAQVSVGNPSPMRKLVPAEALEQSAAQEYRAEMAKAQRARALAPDDHPQLKRLRAVAQRLIPHTPPWNERAAQWQWEVNLLGYQNINAWCMPGGKIAFNWGIVDKLKLTDDEIACVMGHEMAHALREHARERLAKTQATGMGLSLAASLLGLGQVGDLAANVGTQLLTLKFSRDDETEADLVGLEISARGGYDPQASIALWQKMMKAGTGKGPGWLSTHPSNPNRIKQLQANIGKVRGLYEAARPKS